MKHYSLFYGSLRKNEYNYGRFGENTQKYISTHVLNGYQLYSLGVYPMILKGAGSIVVELHEVEPMAAQRIAAMERGAGYREEIIEIAGVKASLWVYGNEAMKERAPLVKSGDWSKRNETNLVPA